MNYFNKKFPIWRDAQQLVILIEKAVYKFPRYHKYTLGSKMRNTAYNILSYTTHAINNSRVYADIKTDATKVAFPKTDINWKHDFSRVNTHTKTDATKGTFPKVDTIKGTFPKTDADKVAFPKEDINWKHDFSRVNKSIKAEGLNFLIASFKQQRFWFNFFYKKVVVLMQKANSFVINKSYLMLFDLSYQDYQVINGYVELPLNLLTNILNYFKYNNMAYIWLKENSYVDNKLKQRQITQFYLGLKGL